MDELTPFQRWYSRNKDTFNARRKARYHQDPEYRKRVLGQIKGVRIRREEKSEEPKMFSISEVADLIERTPQTIRKWETLGLIPTVVEAKMHRRYSHHQVELLKELAVVLKQYRFRELTKSDMNDFVAKLKESWDAS